MRSLKTSPAHSASTWPPNGLLNKLLANMMNEQMKNKNSMAMSILSSDREREVIKFFVCVRALDVQNVGAEAWEPAGCLKVLWEEPITELNADEPFFGLGVYDELPPLETGWYEAAGYPGSTARPR